MQKFKPGKLVLKNGKEFHGQVPAWQQDISFGEVVFNTGMTGYEETLTDPSYSGQILTFTYPILGNYGVSTGSNFESENIHVKGVICQSIYDTPDHYSMNETFLSWLERNHIPLIVGIDTRALTQIIREYGVLEGAIVSSDDMPKTYPNSMAINWVEKVAPKDVYTIGSGSKKVVFVDCGAKKNILNSLLRFDVTLKVVPFDYDYSSEDYAGVFLSNGPGDPKECTKTVNILKKAMQHNKPIYGICLGSQMMALACGADTFKLKFGHRGQNQPCIDTATEKCYLTSQNHGYAVDEKTLPSDWVVSFRHLNDNTVSGIKHKTLPFSSVQFHPEAAAGPHDTQFFFNEFISKLG